MMRQASASRLFGTCPLEKLFNIGRPRSARAPKIFFKKVLTNHAKSGIIHIVKGVLKLRPSLVMFGGKQKTFSKKFENTP
jgi:hypothetical protein